MFVDRLQAIDEYSLMINPRNWEEGLTLLATLIINPYLS